MAENFVKHSEMCRICLSKSKILIPLFKESCNRISLRTMILTCCDVQIFADDGFSTKICVDCGYLIEQAYILKQRIQDSLLKTSEGWFVNCCICDCPTMSCAELETHIKRDHATETNFYCVSCNQSFLYLSTYLAHCLLLHRKPVLVCSQCRMVFQDNGSFHAHLTNHENVEIKCKYCPQNFPATSRYLMEEHISEHHGSVTCQYCSELFLTTAEREKHILNCTKSLACKICGSIFPDKKGVIEHVIADHRDQSPLSCNNCHECFRDEAAMLDHECSNENAQDSPGPCPFCKKRFKFPSTLERHIKTHFKVQEKFTCQICHKRLKGRRSLTVHLRTHTGERPFECNYCNKRFRQTTNLKRHIFSQHKTEMDQRCETYDPASSYLVDDTQAPHVYPLDTSPVFHQQLAYYQATGAGYTQ